MKDFDRTYHEEAAAILRAAAWRLDAQWKLFASPDDNPFAVVRLGLCDAIGFAAIGLAGVAGAFAFVPTLISELATHVGDDPSEWGSRLSKRLPWPMTWEGQEARQELLALAAEYHEALAEEHA